MEIDLMKRVQVYDKAMCCSTGVCGPQVDPVLPRFAADLDWLRAQGHSVERYNLGQQPMEFTRNPDVQLLLETVGLDCLPLIAINGQIVSQREYPSRETLALWTGSLVQHATPVKQSSCCGGGTKCS